MKKTVVILLAVAILGVLGFYATGQGQTSYSTSQSSASVATGSSGSSSPATQGASTATYKDGTFTGGDQSTPYGDVQVAVVIKDGKISDVQFLSMPNDLQHSAELSNYSEPLLKQTTLQNQSAHVDFVSGATSTSLGYEQSLQAALDQAVIQS